MVLRLLFFPHIILFLCLICALIIFVQVQKICLLSSHSLSVSFNLIFFLLAFSNDSSGWDPSLSTSEVFVVFLKKDVGGGELTMSLDII